MKIIPYGRQYIDHKDIKSVSKVLNSELISKFITELNNNNNTFILSLIKDLHPADTADLLETLNSDDRKSVVGIVNESFPSEVLPSMNVPILLDIIEEFELNHLVRMLSKSDIIKTSSDQNYHSIP